MDLGLTGRTYVVTGGTRGLGLAAAEVLVAEGSNVVVSSRDPANVNAAVDRLGPRAHGVVADLGDATTPALLAEIARDHFGDLHGAFLSHGGPPPGPATDLTEAQLEAAIAVSLLGPVRFLRDVAPGLPDGGSVVVLTSTSTIQPIAGLASSNATRAGVWGYAKTLADELAPRGVRVNLLLPGRFLTDRAKANAAARADREGGSVDDILAASATEVPMRRFGDPAELGRVAAFLLSPAASYVTGAAWLVDGGLVRGL